MSTTEQDIRSLYFGCWRGAGHYLFMPGMRLAPLKVQMELLPWKDIDAALCPGWVGAYRTPESVQQQSAAALHVKDGWTALAMWDRTVDSRFQSNSAYFLRGEQDFDDMCMCFKASFTTVWERINRAAPIHLVAQPAPVGVCPKCGPTQLVRSEMVSGQPWCCGQCKRYLCDPV